MCLTANTPKAKKANKDITVYKIFYSGINKKNGKEVLCSPYTDFAFYKDKKYCKAKFRITNHKTIWDYYKLILRYAFKREGYIVKNKMPFDLYYDKVKPFINSFNPYEYYIEDGFLHSYTTKDEIIKIIGFFMRESCEIYECIIPKGCYYYQGIHGDMASRKLKIIKRVY